MTNQPRESGTPSNNFFFGLIHSESISGLLLIISAALAILIANSSLSGYYQLLIDIPAGFNFSDFGIQKPFLLWVNDGLMALFFLLVGLELKREFIEGELKDRANIVLPLFGAIGGMAFPALIYLYFNYGNQMTVSGWAIPAATDIAFALGILSLLGSKVPTSLKIFLTSLAIFDDIGAIIIIALFYTSKLSIAALMVSGVCLVILFFMNRCGVKDKSFYFFIGLIMWASLLKSGVHATLAGVALAMFIPMTVNDEGRSPLKTMEQDLHGLVAFVVLPLFAFCNSGIDLSNLSIEQLMHPVTLGIACGLFLGNQMGIFIMCYIAIKLKLATIPKGAGWLSLYATGILCGVGFTMSLFIGSLAFEETGSNMFFDERLGIILGSLISGIVGILLLNYSLDREKQALK